MKKIKIKYLFIIFVLLLVPTLVLLLMIDKTEEPLPPVEYESTLNVVETKTLSSPENLLIFNNVVTWKPVESASAYVVSVNDTEYVTETNMFNLLTVEEDSGFIKVRALGSDNVLSSINSIERYYLKEINEEDVKDLTISLEGYLNENFSIEIDGHLKNLINDIAMELYLEGVVVKNFENFYQKYLETSNELENVSQFSELITIIYQLMDNEMTDYANVLILKDFVKLNLAGYKQVNTLDNRFDLLLEEIDKFNNLDIETMALTIRYLRDISSLIFEQGDTLIIQLKAILSNDIKSNNSVQLGYDFVTLKNQITQNFILEMPSIEEYEYSINLLSKLYGTMISEDMTQYNLVELFKREFMNFYLEQHRNLYYLDFFDSEHFSKLIVILQNLYNSFGGENFENNIIELDYYYKNKEYDVFLEKLLNYGLTTNGIRDEAQYTKMLNGLKQLNIDLQSENYQYLEEPLTIFFTGLFEYLKINHSASIIVNPLITYMKEGGNYLDHFKDQFILSNYIKYHENMSLSELYDVVKEWDEEDWKIITEFDGDFEDLFLIYQELGLDKIIEIDIDSLNDLIEMKFIVHLVEFVDELSKIDNLIDKISYIFDHFEFQDVIIPLIKELLVNLDERYGTNIDYMQFVLNMFTNMGANPTMVLLNLDEMNNFISSYDTSFESYYSEPKVELPDVNYDEIQIALKKNIVYFIFGDTFDKIFNMFNEEYKTLLDIIEQFKKLVEEINIGDYIKNPDILDLIENLNKNFENTIDVLYNILGNYPFNDEFDWFKILESDRDELLDDLFELEDLFDIIQTNNKDYEGKEPLSSEIPINQEVIDQIISRIAKITQEKIIVD